MRLRAWGVGMKLQSEGTLSMSPVRLFQQRTGAYLLGLQVQYEYESGAQDQHCAAYLSDFKRGRCNFDGHKREDFRYHV
jgi:hypothetical protein